MYNFIEEVVFMRESKKIEFKQDISNSFLKTVSAFSNYGGGEILFGVTDDGKEIGIENPVDACLIIEDKINNTISPNPEYSLDINSNNVIILKVKNGLHKPYLYKDKAYKRNDSSTIQVDSFENIRLCLLGKNLSYEDLQSANQALEFKYLEGKLKEINKISELNEDVLITLGLKNNDEFNNAANILSDNSSFPGIDIIKFGSDISKIEYRKTFDNMSILEAYYKTIEVFNMYYSYESITKVERERVYKIPLAAFREALANAIIHREWDINSSTNVAMYDDKISIVSPGGLPDGIDEYSYLNRTISNVRNKTIADIFFRLNLIEKYGTGIQRIKMLYNSFQVKPKFDISDNSIEVVLPVGVKYNLLTTSEKAVLDNVNKIKRSSSEIALLCGFGKNKTIDILKKLVDNNLILVDGNGRGRKYYRLDN